MLLDKLGVCHRHVCRNLRLAQHLTTCGKRWRSLAGPDFWLVAVLNAVLVTG